MKTKLVLGLLSVLISLPSYAQLNLNQEIPEESTFNKHAYEREIESKTSSQLKWLINKNYIASKASCVGGAVALAGAAVLDSLPITSLMMPDPKNKRYHEDLDSNLAGGILNVIADVVVMTFDYLDGAKLDDTEGYFSDDDYTKPFEYARSAYASTGEVKKRMLGVNSACYILAYRNQVIASVLAKRLEEPNP